MSFSTGVVKGRTSGDVLFIEQLKQTLFRFRLHKSVKIFLDTEVVR